MALLSKAGIEKEFDVRMVERNLSKGFMTEETIEKHSKALVDDQEHGVEVSVEELFESIKGRSPLRRR